MRLARAEVGGAPRVLVEIDGAYALATVQGEEFEDLAALLSSGGAIEPGAEAQPGELLSVVGRPGKVICVGLNYAAHAAETGRPPPDYPMLFPKWHTSLTGPFADVPLPPESQKVDWEAELAFVFGKPARRVKAEDAADVVFGFTAANDVSMRDFQRHTAQYTAGKAWDRATPLGPLLVTADELGSITPDLAISGRLNGETVQDSRTNDLIFGVPELVAYITTAMTMEPGDVVLTGTPSGVGNAMDPPRYLTDGAVFEVEIEGIGTLRNTFRAESL
ncbi:MAG TPA: fumarylacetoacetate hydrolase family protein [Thermoleophilaceae bacterium]|jgi:acylpyruvate hydrolase